MGVEFVEQIEFREQRQRLSFILTPLLFCLYSFCLVDKVVGENPFSKHKERLEFDPESIIPPKYNIHISSPTPTDTPTDVQMAILIVNVRDIKELTEEVTLEMNLKMYWKDERLSYLANWAKDHNERFVVLQPETVEKIWIPDIYVDHVKEITQPSFASKPASLRVYPDMTVRYSARLTLAQACQMDFHYYPADTQRCQVDLMSFSYTDSKLNLTWREGHGRASLVNKLTLPNLDVGMDSPSSYLIITKSGRYTALRFTVLLRRKLSYHLLQTYLPSTLFVFVSWQSFLVPMESVPGRMAICMTTLLTLTAMFSSVRQSTPNVSYIKAIDVWMVSCISFVFLTLLEYTVVLKLRSRGQRRVYAKKDKTERQSRQFPMNRVSVCGKSVGNKEPYSSHFPFVTNQSSTELTTTPGSGSIQVTHMTPPENSPESPTGVTRNHGNGLSYEELAHLIEHFTSGVIPSLFILFNFIYWPWLLYHANYYDRFSNTVYYSPS